MSKLLQSKVSNIPFSHMRSNIKINSNDWRTDWSACGEQSLLFHRQTMNRQIRLRARSEET